MTALDPSIQVATQGVFGLGLQAARGVPRTQNALFNYFPMVSNAYGFNQGMGTLPPEAGKSVTLRGAYKTGIDSQGQISIVPRLIDNFGYIALMLLGHDTVTTGTRFGLIGDTSPYVDTVQSGVNIHTFSFDPDSEVFLPYASVRRVLPGPRKLGELSQDARLGNAEINIPAVGPLTFSGNLMGRVPNGSAIFVNDPDTPWAIPSITYESDESFANAVDPDSYITVMGVRQRCTGLTVSIQNELTPPDQTRIVADQTPYDYVVLARTATVRATVLFTDKALYQSLLAGSTADATTWSGTPLTGDVDFRVYSPDTIAGTSPAVKRALQIRSTNSNIKWALEGVLPLNPRQLMAMNLVGTFVRQTAGNFIEMRVQNGIADAYTQYKVTPITTVTAFTAYTHTITGTGFSGFATGDKVIVSGAANAANNGVFTVGAGSSSTTLVLTETTIVDETVSPAGSVSICA